MGLLDSNKLVVVNKAQQLTTGSIGLKNITVSPEIGKNISVVVGNNGTSESVISLFGTDFKSTGGFWLASIIKNNGGLIAEDNEYKIPSGSVVTFSIESRTIEMRSVV